MKTYRQSGNVLFLILIAVALFAALSYAVTQTSQVGSGNTDKMADKVNFSVLMNYITAVRTRAERMRMSDGIANPLPQEHSSRNASVYSDSCDFNPEQCIFGAQMPFHKPERINALVKMNVVNARTRVLIGGPLNRLYTYIYYSPVAQDVCEGFNRYVYVDVAPNAVSNDSDIDDVLVAMEGGFAKCIYLTDVSENAIFMKIYDAEFV